MFFSKILSIATLAAAAIAQTNVSVTYDPIYDNASLSLDYVACSDGEYGLITKGYNTTGELPRFPYIGGAISIEGYDSENCGSCYNLTYNEVTITVLAIDVAKDGFNIAEEALNVLTNGEAVQLGRITATAIEVNATECGL